MNVRKKQPFIQYFADIWAAIATTYLGMQLTLRYFFTKPVTMEYPEVQPEIPEGHRGIHAFDEPKCMVCKACQAACPVGALTIESIGKGKDTLVTRFDIDYSKCLFCDLCTTPCPNGCLMMTKKYDLAGTTREECVVHFARPKTEDEIAAHQAMLARKEAEKKAKLDAAKKEAKPAADKPPEKEL